MTALRIALLTSASGWRGSGASFAKLAAGLAARGHTVRLVTAAPRLTARMRDEGLDPIELALPRTGLREVRALHRVLLAAACQAIMVDTPRDLRVAVLASLLTGTNVIYRYNLNYRRARNHLADRLVVGRAAACVYQSEFIRRDAMAQLPSLARRAAFVIPNGYDLDRYAPDPNAARELRRQWGVAEDATIVLTGAKLARDKGHETAIGAMALLRERGADVVLVVGGDGAREAELRALVAARGVPAVFTGFLPVSRMIGAYSAADVVVHPARREIFPNVVAEAMACGRAVVAVDDGGTAEVVGRDGGAGVLVPPDDPRAMADAIRPLLDDAGRRARLGAAARARIAEQFPLARMIDGYESMFAEVIGAGG